MIVREIFAQWINRFLRGIEDESYFFMFYRVNRTGKIYGPLFILRERCITCAMFCQIENIQAESWSGSKVTRQRRWISNSTDSTTREIPPLVKYSKHRTKLPRKQLGKSTIEERRHKKSIRYIIEYLEIDTKPKHRVSVRKIIAIPFDRSRENLEPRSEQTSTVEDQVDFTHRFLLLSMENWKKIHGPIRSTTDWLSIPSSYLLRQLESKKKGMKKKKKRIQRGEGKEIDSFVNHLFSRDKLNFFRVGGGGAGERVAQRACKSERGTTYFYPGRSTGRYGFFARCRRSRVSWRAFEARRGKWGGKEREMDIRRDGKRGERRRDSGRKFKVLLDLSSKRNGIPTWWVCSVCLLFRISAPWR